MKNDLLLFLDESGDHLLTWKDPDYPLFVLSCIIVRPSDYIEVIIPALGKIKVKYWGHEGVVLHSSEIRRQEGLFGILRNRDTRECFMDDLRQAITCLPYGLTVAIIDKRKPSIGNVSNPYSLALHSCLKQAQQIMPGAPVYKVIAESRGTREDAELISEADSLPIIVAPKRGNLAGLQMADLCAYPCGRHYLNPMRNNRAWDDVAQKMRGGSASWEILK